MSQRNLSILLLATILSYACYVRGGQNPYARYVADGLLAIEQGSLDRVPDRDLLRGAMDGMVGVLRQHGDEHSQFLAEEDADPLRAEIRQQFGGIGVRIGLEGEPPRLAIVGPPDPGMPAARANLMPGDFILTVDGKATDGMDLGETLRRMRGLPGTTVRLEIEQAYDGTRRQLELVREIINIESILGDRRRDEGGWHFQLEADPRIAHIRITSFGDRTAEELAGVMDDIKRAGAKVIVLDLRDNAGGALDAAVAVCDMLLPAERLIVETRGRGHELRSQYKTTGDARFTDLPLVVVVNQNSASAAEIVAACLQDHDRAIVVGERTYGKGTVQQLLPLESGKSLLKLTWANFWRPSGQKIHRAAGGADDESWGVVPNEGYALEFSPEQYAAFRKYRTDRDLIRRPLASEATENEGQATTDFVDEQLQMAVEYLTRQLSDHEL